MTKRSGISFNKAVLPIFQRLVALELIRNPRRSSTFFFTELSWWERGVDGVYGEAFFNKPVCGLLCL
jgi:hypothetical protein